MRTKTGNNLPVFVFNNKLNLRKILNFAEVFPDRN